MATGDNGHGTTIHGKPRQSQKRPGKEVMAARIRVVADALLDGSVGLDPVEWIRTQEADKASPFYVGQDREPLSYDQCRRMVRKGHELIAQTVENDRERLVATHRAKRAVLYARCVKKGDERTALAVLQDECELLGLYPRKTDQPNGNGSGIPALSAIVFAIMRMEKAGSDEPRRVESACEGTGRGGEAVPRLSSLLRDDVLQDPVEP